MHGDGSRTPIEMDGSPVKHTRQSTHVEAPELVDVSVRQAEANQLPHLKPFSIVEKLDSAIAVGLALGWDMSGCIRNLEDIIAENGASIVHP